MTPQRQENLNKLNDVLERIQARLIQHGSEVAYNVIVSGVKVARLSIGQHPEKPEFFGLIYSDYRVGHPKPWHECSVREKLFLMKHIPDFEEHLRQTSNERVEQAIEFGERYLSS